MREGILRGGTDAEKGVGRMSVVGVQHSALRYVLLGAIIAEDDRSWLNVDRQLPLESLTIIVGPE